MGKVCCGLLVVRKVAAGLWQMRVLPASLAFVTNLSGIALEGFRRSSERSSEKSGDGLAAFGKTPEAARPNLCASLTHFDLHSVGDVRVLDSSR